MSSLAAPSACPICGRRPGVRLTLQNGQPLRWCGSCRLGWWDWPAFDPAGFYDRDYFASPAAKGYGDYASLERGVRRTARARLGRIEALLSPQAAAREPRRIIDLGCGTGWFLDEARELGWSTSGIEVSPYASAEAVRRGLEVRSEPLEEIELPAGAFDVVTLWDVIEHVRDPVGVLDRVARGLLPGGVLALSTGDVLSLCARLSGARWHLFNLPEHLFFFSVRSLTRLLERAGCRVVRIVRELNWVPVSYVFERLGKTLLRADSRRCPALMAGWLLPATLLDVLGVYAVRRTDR